MIPFNTPPYTGDEDQFVLDAMRGAKLCGDGPYALKCQKWFEQQLGCPKTLLTPSCTHALELASILLDIEPGDEVIMPSYTFVSTANPFVLRGAKIVFVDIRPDTMNINEGLIESAITKKTKAIVPVHYAGVSCDMDAIMQLADKYNLFVIEDAAQAFYAFYKNTPVGTRGHMAAFSFHETKNITSGGEGGLLVINDERFIHRAEIIREKGTNRSQFFRGMVDKYTWVDVGSSYLPSEIQAAYLYSQLLNVEKIQTKRKDIWNKYHKGLQTLAERNVITLPTIPEECSNNAHMFYLKVSNLDQRSQLLSYLKDCGVLAVFHYVPLHSSMAGKSFGDFVGNDDFTTTESDRLVRLPLYYGMSSDDCKKVIRAVLDFFSQQIT
ncbi:dTDP-4-amino-4,6-dideoxygalactose transaminase [Rheinheimera mesophila]|uniref:dTDP-4-amino-4,6-dideoxygalactose transaminase n=1 Tax=Rheinheimera mesophila TaxID=1547515 RepID=A0A3P3QRI8_9GAMM|nr:dTDP-4-amino-4,6-dideoxygalactose transaminase [Rheinheimera mesophila]KKL00433.1 TDP-4-oxo-6-deoxy-D-glucose aminotransferase [Rheinheimera mesophila]RRJ23139.1 dTDP-4-amino-4,6-dideoxygalactose transaminase [Rheinheimera mesophila]